MKLLRNMRPLLLDAFPIDEKKKKKTYDPVEDSYYKFCQLWEEDRDPGGDYFKFLCFGKYYRLHVYQILKIHRYN